MKGIKSALAGGTALAFLLALVIAPLPAYAEDEPGASSEIVATDTADTDETAPAGSEDDAVIDESEATEEAAIIVTDTTAKELTPTESIMSALRVAPANNGGANNTNETAYWENQYSAYGAVCYKDDSPASGTDHGYVDGKRVVLKTYGAGWYGSGYIVLIVDGGSNEAVYEFPVAGTGTNYVSPLNGGGNIPNVSHWIVCKGDIPDEPELLVASASVTKTDPTCKVGETLVWVPPTNALYSGTPDGTVGPANYNVVANANSDAEFSPGVTQLTWEGTLAGPLTGPQCDDKPTPTATLTGDATCEANGTWSVIWTGTLANYGSLSEVDIKVIKHLPAGSLINGVDAQVWLYEWIEHNANHNLPPFPENGVFTYTQTGIPGSATSATSAYQYDFKGGPSGDPETTITLTGDCTPPPPPPSFGSCPTPTQTVNVYQDTAAAQGIGTTFTRDNGTLVWDGASWIFSTPGSNDKITFGLTSTDFAIPLSELTALSFEGVLVHEGSDPRQIVSFNIPADVNGSAPGGFTTIVVEAVYNGGSFDAFMGGDAIVWSSNAVNGFPNRDTFKSWKFFLEQNPNTMLGAQVLLNQGGGNAGLVTQVTSFTAGNSEECIKYVPTVKVVDASFTAPTIVDSCGIANDGTPVYGEAGNGSWKTASVVTMPNGDIRYRVVYTPGAGETVPAPGDGDTYTIVDGKAVWLLYTTDVPCPDAVFTPPVLIDECGVENDGVTFGESKDGTWKIGSVTVMPDGTIRYRVVFTPTGDFVVPPPASGDTYEIVDGKAVWKLYATDEACGSTTTVVNTDEPFPGVDMRLLGLAAGSVVLAIIIAGLIALYLVRSKRRGQTA